MAKRKYQTGGRVRESEGYIELEGGPMTDEEFDVVASDTVRRVRSGSQQDAGDAGRELSRVHGNRMRDISKGNREQRREGTRRYAGGGAVRGDGAVARGGTRGKIC